MRSASNSGETTTGPAVPRTFWFVSASLLILGTLSLAVYTGFYDVAADVPHSQPVYWLLQTIRGRSIAARASNVVVPADLYSPKRIPSSGNVQRLASCSRYGADRNQPGFISESSRAQTRK